MHKARSNMLRPGFCLGGIAGASLAFNFLKQKHGVKVVALLLIAENLYIAVIKLFHALPPVARVCPIHSMLFLPVLCKKRLKAICRVVPLASRRYMLVLLNSRFLLFGLALTPELCLV